MGQAEYAVSLVKYLSVLRQSFHIISIHCLDQERRGLAFAGRVAQDLHNLPGFLRRPLIFDEEYFWTTLLNFRSHIVAPYSSDLTSIAQVAEKAESENCNFQVPPPAVLEAYLDLAHWFFILLRPHGTQDAAEICKPLSRRKVIFCYASSPWTDEKARESLGWGNLAHMLSDISDLMLHWDTERALRLPETWPDAGLDLPLSWQSRWKEFIDSIKSAEDKGHSIIVPDVVAKGGGSR